MATPETKTNVNNAEGLPDLQHKLTLIGGTAVPQIAETVPLETGGLRKNLEFLQRQGVSIGIAEAGGANMAIGVQRTPDEVICSLLHSLDVTGLKEFPGRTHVAKPDIYEAITPFLLAKDERRPERLKFSDGGLAVTYDPEGTIYVENLNGSENNGLRGAPEHLLRSTLQAFDMEAEAARMKMPLTWQKAAARRSYGGASITTSVNDSEKG